MRKRHRKTSKADYIKATESMLSEFGIAITPDVSAELDSRYPDEYSIERYTRKLIMNRLGDD